MKVLFYWNDYCNIPSDVRVNRKTCKGVQSALKKKYPGSVTFRLVSLKRNKEGDVRLLISTEHKLELLWGVAVVIKDNSEPWNSNEISTARAIVQQRLNNIENVINFGDGKSLNTK